jgi:TRAP transporter TAXI family solute receptor
MRLLAAVRCWRGSCVAARVVSCARFARVVALALAALPLAGQAGLAQVQQVPQTPQTPPAATQPPPPPPKVVQRVLNPQQILRAKLNQETLIVAASRPGGTYMAMANDLVAAVGTGGSLRVLPMAAEGGLANLQDLLFLRGVDLAIVATSVLANAKATGAFGGGLNHKVVYVAPLYGEEVHVVAGVGVASIDDLRGKKVAVPLDDGTALFTARDLLQRLGVACEEVPMEAPDALEAVRAGTLAAAMLVAGKPVAMVSGLPKDGSLRLLGLPHSAALGEGYSPAVLLAEDYPALIPPDAIVETVAVRAVLLASSDKGGEETARRIAKQVPALFDAIARLATSQRHPKWREVNLGAVLPGWTRAAAGEAWLSKASERQRQVLEVHFDEFLRARNEPASAELSTTRRKKLFEQFQSWARKSITSQVATP